MRIGNKILLSIVLSILFSSFALTQEPDFSTFNPDDPESFDYINGDYSTINDWSNVDWNQIDYSNPTLNFEQIPVKYAEQVDVVRAIVAGRGQELTVEQISYDLENIENLATDVKEDRAREAIQHNYRVTVVSLGSNAKIVNNVLHAEFGEQDSIDLNGKPAWKIEINDEGIVNILEPQEITRQKITQQDSFTLVAETRFTSQSGSVNTVQHLSFRNGQAYVKEGDTARIGEYEIPAESNRVDIYFDPTTKPTGNYISISESGLDIGTTPGNTVKIIPQAGNELFYMFKREYLKGEKGNFILERGKPMYNLVPDSKDNLIISIKDGNRITVSSREQEGLVPLLNHYYSSTDGSTNIKNGVLEFTITKGKLEIKPPRALNWNDFSKKYQSVAMEVISDTTPGILRISSGNAFGVAHSGNEMVTYNEIPVSNQLEDNTFQTVDDLAVIHPEVKFSFDNGAEWGEDYSPSPGVIQAFNMWLERKKAENLESLSALKSVSFSLGDNAEGDYGTLLFMEPDTNIIPHGRFKSIFYPFEHEFNHVADEEIYQRELELLVSQKTDNVQRDKIKQFIEIRNKLKNIRIGGEYPKNYFDLLKETRRLSSEVDKILERYPTLQNTIEGRAQEAIRSIQSDNGFKDKVTRFKAEAEGLAQKEQDPHQKEYFSKIADSYEKLLNPNLEFTEFKKIYDELQGKLNEYYTNPILRRINLFPNTYSFSDTFELSSTFIEGGTDEIAKRSKSPNPVQRKLYRDMTQIFFDSGKITQEQCNSILKTTCGKCVIYRLGCSE